MPGLDVIEPQVCAHTALRVARMRDLAEVVRATRADIANVSAGGSPTWDSITGKPSVFTPSAHTHPISDVTSLQAALDGKQAAGSYAAATHAHAIADVTSLQAALDAKADDSDLSAHVAAADPHAGYQKESEKAAASGYASLDANTLVPGSQLGSGSPDATKFLRGDRTWAVPSGGGGGVPTTIATVGGIECFRQTADVTNATVTPANLPGLVFTFAPNALYIIDLYLMASSVAATTGYGFDFDTSLAVTYVGLTFEHQLATSGTLSGGDSIADAAPRGLSSGVPAVTVTNMILGKGALIAAPNSGTCQLRFRPEVAASATAKANSVIRVQRIT